MRMPQRLSAASKSHVRHGCGYHNVAGQQASGLQVARGHKQDRIAVDDVAACVGQHTTVGIAIEGDAEVCSARLNLARYEFWMQCAAVRIDVAAVGRGVQECNAGELAAVQPAQKLRCDGRSRAVGAIGDDFQTG